MAKSYLIGERLLDRVKTAVDRVEGIPVGVGGFRIQTRFDSLPQQSSENPIRLAAYQRDFDWKRGETAQITIYTHTGTAYGPMISGSGVSATPVTATALNVSQDLALVSPLATTPDAGPTPTMTWCIVGRRAGVDMLIEGPAEPHVQLADRTADAPWPLGGEEVISLSGSYHTVTAINLAGDYEPWDAKSQNSDPALLAVRGLGSDSDTQWYVVAPPPVNFDTGTWDSAWGKGSQKEFTLSNGYTVQAGNTLFDMPASGSGAVAKRGGTWTLVSVELETFTATTVTGVEARTYASQITPCTVVTSVTVEGELKQSAAPPILVNLVVTQATHQFVTGVTVYGTLTTSSAASPVSVATTLTTANVAVLDSVDVTATLNTSNCAITVTKATATKNITVATGVQAAAVFDPSKLTLAVEAIAQTASSTFVQAVDVEAEWDLSKLWVDVHTTAVTALVDVVQATATGLFVQATQTASFIRFPSAEAQ